MIHVCFCMSDKTGRYSKFIGTTMFSLFDNHTPHGLPSITVHLLHDNTLTPDNRDKFAGLAKQYNQRVKFYNVEELCADKIAEIRELFPQADKTRFTIGMFYRFFIPNVLPQSIDKAIYLDGDIIVNLDINELWQFELKDSPLAVVTIFSQKGSCYSTMCIDGIIDEKDYFNSGVLMMNLKFLRNEENYILNGINFLRKNPKHASLPDQEILNYYFAKNALKLPMKFNRLVKWARRFNPHQVEKMIYHFNAHDSVKGLGTDMSDLFNRLWMSYFIRTPWFDADSIGRLCESYREVRNNLMEARLKFYRRMRGKTRAFFVEPERIDTIKKIFTISNDEPIIPAENEESLQKLFDAMKLLKGKYVFFIMTPKFMEKPFPFDLLTEEGFAYNKDYMKGWYYFSEADGGSFNTNPFIQAM